MARKASPRKIVKSKRQGDKENDDETNDGTTSSSPSKIRKKNPKATDTNEETPVEVVPESQSPRGARKRPADIITAEEPPPPSPPNEDVTANDDEAQSPEEEIPDDDDDHDDDDDAKLAAVEKPDIDLTKPIKRARTAYFIFADENRAAVQTKHRGEGLAAVAKELGQLWATLSKEEREVYQEKAALEREAVARQLVQMKEAGIDLSTLPGAAQASEAVGAAANALIYPLGRFRKIVKLDPEVKGLSKEALLLVTKCTELMTTKLGIETVRVAQIQNRRTLMPDDICNVTQTREQFFFLKDDVKDFVREQVVQKLKDKNDNATTALSSKDAKAASNSKPLTSYFATKGS